MARLAAARFLTCLLVSSAPLRWTKAALMSTSLVRSLRARWISSVPKRVHEEDLVLEQNRVTATTPIEEREHRSIARNFQNRILLEFPTHPTNQPLPEVVVELVEGDLALAAVQHHPPQLRLQLSDAHSCPTSPAVSVRPPRRREPQTHADADAHRRHEQVPLLHAGRDRDLELGVEEKRVEWWTARNGRNGGGGG
jgi:hypothetical protein